MDVSLKALSAIVLRPRECGSACGGRIVASDFDSTLSGTNPVDCVLYSSPKINDGAYVINFKLVVFIF